MPFRQWKVRDWIRFRVYFIVQLTVQAIITDSSRAVGHNSENL